MFSAVPDGLLERRIHRVYPNNHQHMSVTSPSISLRGTHQHLLACFVLLISCIQVDREISIQLLFSSFQPIVQLFHLHDQLFTVELHRVDRVEGLHGLLLQVRRTLFQMKQSFLNRFFQRSFQAGLVHFPTNVIQLLLEVFDRLKELLAGKRERESGFLR